MILRTVRRFTTLLTQDAIYSSMRCLRYTDALKSPGRLIQVRVSKLSEDDILAKMDDNDRMEVYIANQFNNGDISKIFRGLDYIQKYEILKHAPMIQVTTQNLNMMISREGFPETTDSTRIASIDHNAYRYTLIDNKRALKWISRHIFYGSVAGCVVLYIINHIRITWLIKE